MTIKKVQISYNYIILLKIEIVGIDVIYKVDI